MRRPPPILALLAALVAPSVAARPAAAQIPTPAGAARPAAPAPGWNDPRTLDLVRRAMTRRQTQLADTALVDYQAAAHGYLTFLAQLGEGFTEPPRVVKADELALEVYWKAPNLSRQRIVGRRDTLLLPTDINYHRDHLGIVQNNFPDIIRLGDGDEVLDVPHPLAPQGFEDYDYAIGDSVRVRLPDRTISVFAVRVRPKNDRLPRAVGAVFIDTAEAQVVRMAFSFTRAALRDEQLEDVSIVLENSIVESRFWLPRRQEIEIRRTGTFLEYPARGIIRGRWEICCYQVNRGLPLSYFRGGPEIVQAPPQTLRTHQWPAPRVLDELPPDVRAVTDEEVKKVQEEARELVRAQALARARHPAISARGVTDFLRVNRAEGLAVGAGATRQLGGGAVVTGRGRYGLDDERFKGRLGLEWRAGGARAARLGWFRDVRDASEEPETSGLRNTIAAQETGSDYTEPYGAHGVELALEGGLPRGLRLRLAASGERHEPLAVAATPVNGRYEPTIPAARLDAVRASARVSRPTALAWLGTELSASLEGRMLAWKPRDHGTCAAPLPCAIDAGRRTSGHLTAVYQLERPFGDQRLVLHGVAAGALGGEVPAQELVYLGGPTTGPGYRFHEFVGRAGASQRVEWRLPVPVVGVPLGRFGRTPARATLAPFAQAVWISRRTLAPGVAPARRAWYPALGVGALTLFDVLRFDVARGLTDGRWTFSVDVARDFWSVL